jgi:hypothetical protein
MAWEVQRLHSNQTFSIGVEPAESVLRTQFLVAQNTLAHDGSGEDGWTIWKLIKAQTAPFNVIEAMGSRLALSSVDVGLAQMIVTDIDVQTHPAKNNCYIVTQTAKAVLLGESPYRGLKISEQSSARPVQQYIRPKPGLTSGSPAGSFPPSGNVTWPPTTLISNGLVTNVMGNPIQFLVRQNIIRLEFLIHEPATSVGYTSFPTNPRSYLYHRNTNVFLGAAAGRILFQSYESRYVSDQVKMDVYTFVDDDWFHLEQMVLRNPVDGSIWNDSTQSLGGSTVKCTARAVWFQPYEPTAAFDTPGVILPTEILNFTASIPPGWV